MSNTTMTLQEWTPFLKTLGDLLARGAYDASIAMEGSDVLVVKNSSCTGTVSLMMAPCQSRKDRVLVPVIRLVMSSKICESIEEFDLLTSGARGVRDALYIAQEALEGVRISIHGD